MCLMMGVPLNKQSWKGDVAIHYSVSCLTLDRRSILTMCGGSTHSLRWIPPPLPQQTSSKSPEHEKDSGTTFAAGRSRRVDQERPLTDSQRDEFEDMLRALTLERSQIKEAMGFALDNADAAGEVVEVLTESLTLKETPIPTKVARLMLVSDVLHNSSAPVKNASAYRTKFEATLPDIMESFNDLYRNVTGRITAEALKVFLLFIQFVEMPHQ
eukprot:Gb_01264 [translate_table: standard]